MTPAKSVQKTAILQSSSFSKNDHRYWEQRVFLPVRNAGDESYQSSIYYIKLQFRGTRKTLSTGESSKRSAGKKALEIYQSLRASGWVETLKKYRGEMERRSDLTVGQFLEVIRERSTLKPKTFAGYASRLRLIVARLEGIDATKVQKSDYVNGGASKWREKIGAVKLAKLTPERINKWRVTYLAAAGADPRKQTSSRHSFNTIIRNAKALFAPRILELLSDIDLPSPLPFEGVRFEKEGSKRYRSEIDPQKLLTDAKVELAAAEPESEIVLYKGQALPHDSDYSIQRAEDQANSKREAFKVLLLALCVGLRRDEIDKLQWSQFLWQMGCLRIEETDCFSPKADSAGDVPVDSEVLQFFQLQSNNATSRFVIAGGDPRPDSEYQHYRAARVHRALLKWLRLKDVTAQKPIHSLRKQYGSIICRQAGILAASQLLRHSDIRVTSKYYVDDGRHITSGLGSLLAN